MSAEGPGSGAAREIPKGRLAGFEDDPAPNFTLPPRPGRASHPANAQGLETSTAAALAAETEPDSADPTDEMTARISESASGPARASNVHIPVALLEAFTAAKTAQNLSNGELIICAIEATYADLQRQLRPPSPTGGNLFAQRVTRPPRVPATGPVTPLNYRLRPDDYATLDRLVRDLGASSRSHLITEALRGYLSRTA